jgi:hypothetical protein
MPPPETRRGPEGLAPGARQDRLGGSIDKGKDTPTLAFDSATEVMADLAERATVDAYRAHGPIPADAIEQAAEAMSEAAVRLVTAGWPEHADAALRCAYRLDETAELARLLELRDRSAA